MSLWLAGYPKTPGFDVRFGSQADMAASISDVRFTPESGHPISVSSDHSQNDQQDNR